MIYIRWHTSESGGIKAKKKKKKTQGFVCLHMPIHIPGMWRMASGRQQRPCICGSISCPPCRLASYLLNETVPTDLDNRTLASGPRSLHWELCCITESPCARAKQHRQPWTRQWVDTGSHIIGSYRCCYSFSLKAADDFFSPGRLLS